MTSHKHERVLELVPRMLELRQQGYSFARIADELGVQKNTVIHRISQGPQGWLLEGVPAMPTGYALISESWWCQFRGFFYGEGHVNLGNSRSGKALSPLLNINLRIDDKPLLDSFAVLLGGRVYIKKAYKQSAPQAMWHLPGWNRFYHVLLHLRCTDFPAKKLPEIELAIACCEARFQMPHNLTTQDSEILHAYAQKIRDMRLLS